MASKIEPAFAIWLTGLPASGKSTITEALKKLLDERGIDAAVLESDVLRKVFSENPGYGEEDRDIFYRRVAWLGVLLTRHGVPVIFDATANRQRYRDAARRDIPKFLEIFVDVPLETCMERDPKGIYRNAAATGPDGVPGLRAPYEPPAHPDLVVDGLHETPPAAARRILAVLIAKRYL